MRKAASLTPDIAGVPQRLPMALTQGNRPVILGVALGIILLLAVLRWIGTSAADGPPPGIG